MPEGLPCTDFWQGKRVLLTGHTGFKGAWLSLWLQKLGALVTGIALPPSTTPSLFQLANLEQSLISSHFCDIRDAQALGDQVKAASPDIVFHLAAQALVRPSYANPIETYTSNIMGTTNLLEGLRTHPGTRVAVIITTDKVYRNKDWEFPYRETDELGGYDPYSSSKAACELIAASYRDAFLCQQGLALATARAGNVIGGGDWAQDRLIPDAIRAWQKNCPLKIRAPCSIRPWQHVLEPLAGYLVLAEKLWHHPEWAGPFNFGPYPQDACNVGKVVELAHGSYGKGQFAFEVNPGQLHEAKTLTLDISKSKQWLGVKPRWNIRQAIDKAMCWYRDLERGKTARDLCLEDIRTYEASQ